LFVMSNSLWIIFFVKIDILPEPFKSYFVLFTAIEVQIGLIGDFLTLVLALFGIYVFYKVQYFHYNLLTLCIDGYSIGFLFVISRFIQIPIQFGVFALCFVATYENAPRRYISVIIIIYNYAVSALLGYLIVHKIVHGFYYLAFVCIASNISYLTFLYLNFAGKRKKKELLKKISQLLSEPSMAATAEYCCGRATIDSHDHHELVHKHRFALHFRACSYSRE
ncbi:hypothetical protein PENTCL1PPCAC_29310, partial [Pristionchus entomophagus]